MLICTIEILNNIIIIIIKKREYTTFSTMMAFNFLVSLPNISTMLLFFVYKAKKVHLLNH